MRAANFHASSFPNSIWERSLLLAKFHFALTSRGNGIAPTIAFPNGVWERGRCLVVGAIIFVLSPASAAFAQEPFATDDYRISHADVAYFFDSISFDKGIWRFGLSKNSVGMQWRTNPNPSTQWPPNSKTPDAVGICKYKQTLIVPDGTFLEISGKDFSITFLRSVPGDYTVRAQLKAGFRDSFKNRTREATDLDAKSDGTFMVIIGID
jgi:hypothetical protein